MLYILNISLYITQSKYFEDIDRCIIIRVLLKKFCYDTAERQ